MRKKEPYSSALSCFFLVFALLLILFIFPLSCAKTPPNKQKSELRLNITQDPTTLDPRKSADFTTSTIHFLLFEGLVKMTPYSTVSPGIAEKVDVSEDAKTYTFFLREAKWSNGADITAFDFVQTWKDMLSPDFACPNAHLLFPIKNAEAAKKGEVSLKEVGIRALDHRTLQVSLESPTPFFLEMVSFCVYFPAPQNIVQRDSHWADSAEGNFTCNGPYRIAKWKHSNELVLEKNPLYWDFSHVNLERIKISIIDNEVTALKMFETGELDILGLPFTGIPSDSVPSLLDKGIIKATSLPASTICCFNINSYPFHNCNIRKAFAYAINRQEIVDNVTTIASENGIYTLPKVLFKNQKGPFFKDGDARSARLHFKKGLKELGITEDEIGQITLLHASSSLYSRVAQALQQQWRRVLGVHVELCPYEYKVFLDKLSKRDYQMSQCVWIAQYLDPMNFFERFKNVENVKNYPGYSSETYSKLLEESSRHLDETKRMEYFNLALEELMSEMPLTAIYHWNGIYLKQERVENLLFNPSGGFYLPSIRVNTTKIAQEPRKKSRFIYREDLGSWDFSKPAPLF